MIEIVQPSAFSIQPLVLILAFILDIAIGDPVWMPHPIRVIGRFISKTETLLRKSGTDNHKMKSKIQDYRFNTEEKLKGILLVAIIVGSTFGITWFIVYTLAGASTRTSALLIFFSTALMIYLSFTTIAVKELANAARRVIDAIKEADIKSARTHLSMIVGRDTKKLSEKNILKATMETLSENLSDGVVAPLFYLAIGGIPAAMAYKAINTLDSMVGYKNDKYRYFGWASARLDDIANYIPARITGAIIVASSAVYFRSLATSGDSLRTMIIDGKKHSSPNAGIPEAAMAGALGVMLGGPSSYGGIVHEKPYIGQEKTENYLIASEKTVGIIRLSSVIAAAIAAMVLYLRGAL